MGYQMSRPLLHLPDHGTAAQLSQSDLVVNYVACSATASSAALGPPLFRPLAKMLTRLSALHHQSSQLTAREHAWLHRLLWMHAQSRASLRPRMMSALVWSLKIKITVTAVYSLTLLTCTPLSYGLCMVLQ